MFKGKKINQPQPQHIFPVVRGTEHWPYPLFDMPDIHIEVTPEMSEKLDRSMKRIRNQIKDCDFVTNYGVPFFTVPAGDFHE